MVDLYLASQSPRRAELLEQIGVRFERLKIDVPEEKHATETPQEYVCRLAQEKAKAGAMLVDKPVLGSDTIVVLGEEVLEKPKNEKDGLAMLAKLSGRVHQVMTAVAVAQNSRCEVELNITSVQFRKIATQEAKRYWDTGEPTDKAGGYGIQGLAAVFVQSIEGSYSGVVGLPLNETADLLARFDVPIWAR